MNPNAQAPAATTAPVSRRNKIAEILSEVFEELSGVDVSQADGSTSFLEMGFDSLFLTQVTQALHAKFGLKITFRQLLGDLCSMDALSEHIDSKLAGRKFWPRRWRPLWLLLHRLANARGSGECPARPPTFLYDGFRQRKWRWPYVGIPC